MTAIVYFSRSFENLIDGKKESLHVGNTKIVAQKIAEILDVEVFEIIPEIAYSKDYQEVVAQAEQEKITNERPKYQPISLNLEKHQTIYLGYPNWWGTFPMIIATFLEKNDLSEKIFIPSALMKAAGWAIVSESYRNFVLIQTFILGYLFVGPELQSQILQSKMVTT